MFIPPGGSGIPKNLGQSNGDVPMWDATQNKWVASPLPANLIFYLQNDASDVSGYKKLLMTPYATKTATNYTPANGTHVLVNFVTEPSVPGATYIPAGTFLFHIHAKRATGTFSVYAEFWECDAFGVDIAQIGSATEQGVVGTTETEFQLTWVTSEPYIMAAATSRIVCRIYAITTSNPTCTLYWGQEADSHISLPSNTAITVGSGDVIGSGTPIVGDLVKATNVDGKHIAPATRVEYNAVDHGGAVQHSSNDVGAGFRSWLAGLSNCVIVFPPGTYSLTSDLTTPTTVHIKPMKGAFFKPAKIAQTGNALTYSMTTQSASTLTSIGNCVIIGAGTAPTDLYPGCTIQITGAGTNAGQTAIVRSVGTDRGASTKYIKTWTAFSPVLDGSSQTWKYSNYVISTASAHGLIGGERIYFTDDLSNAQEVIVKDITAGVNPTTATSLLPIPASASGVAWSRGVRLIIAGTIQDCDYQILDTTGGGTIHFVQGSVPMIKPEWFGGTGYTDNLDATATKNTLAFQLAATCGTSGSGHPRYITIKLGSGDYYTMGNLPIFNGVKYRGQGADTGLVGGTIVSTKPTAQAHTFIHTPNTLGYPDPDMIGVCIMPAYQTPCVNGIDLYAIAAGATGTPLWLDSVAVYNAPGYGIAGPSHIGNYDNIHISGCAGGIKDCAGDFKIQAPEISVSARIDDSAGSVTTTGITNILLDSAVTGTGSKWSGTNWASNGTHTVGSIAPMVQTITATLERGWDYFVGFTISSGATAGSITGVQVAGLDVLKGDVVGTWAANSATQHCIGMVYMSAQHPTGTTTIAITPSTDFNGAINDVFLLRVGSGLDLSGGTYIYVENPIIYGDGRARAGVVMGASNVLTGGRIDSSYYNAYLTGNSKISGVDLLGDGATPKTFADVGGTLTSDIVEDCNIGVNNNNYPVWGVYWNSGYGGGSIISRNKFDPTSSTPGTTRRFQPGYQITTNSTGNNSGVTDYPIFENNYGFDLATTWPTTPTPNATGVVQLWGGKHWKFNESGAYHIFANPSLCSQGKELWIYFTTNAVTTIWFKGGAGGGNNIIGNGNKDYIAAAGDLLYLKKFDSTNNYWIGTIFKANGATSAGLPFIASSTSGNLMSWSGTAGDTPADSGYAASLIGTLDTELTSGDNPGHLHTTHKLDPTIVNLAYSGSFFTATAGENVAIGDVCYLKSDGKYYLAKADVANTKMPGVVIATGTISASASGVFLQRGFLRYDTWSGWTVGGLLYVTVTGTTTNTLTQTAPSASGNIVQIVGYAYAAKVIFFDPNLVQVQVA